MSDSFNLSFLWDVNRTAAITFTCKNYLLVLNVNIA